LFAHFGHLLVCKLPCLLTSRLASRKKFCVRALQAYAKPLCKHPSK